MRIPGVGVGGVREAGARGLALQLLMEMGMGTEMTGMEVVVVM